MGKFIITVQESVPLGGMEMMRRLRGLPDHILTTVLELETDKDLVAKIAQLVKGDK